MDYEETINSLKEQLENEIKLSNLNKEYIIFLENKIEDLERINSDYLNKIDEYLEKINELGGDIN